MTNQQKLEAISAFIRSKCPELQELSFGCVVFREDWLAHTKKEYCFVKIIARSGEDEPGVYHAIGMDGKGDCFVQPGLFDKIIGHDITFAAVCSAIGEHFGGQLVDLQIHENKFCRMTLPSQNSISCVLDLGKPLHQQKPEVIDFLYQIFNLNEDE